MGIDKPKLKGRRPRPRAMNDQELYAEAISFSIRHQSGVIAIMQSDAAIK